MTAREDILRALKVKAYELRRDVLDMIYHAGSGHPGGSLSAAEIITVLYWYEMNIAPSDPRKTDRDRFVLSKGHAAPILYAALAGRGYFSKDHLSTLRQINSILQGHPDMKKTPGLDMSTGSLGQGLSLSLGIALATRHLKIKYRVFALLSDGELQEGMIWEAAMAAAHYGAENLVALVDSNKLQVDGEVRAVMNVDPIEDKWRAFGWETLTIDGHDVSSIIDALEQTRAAHEKPTVIICNTVKGKGVSFMENVMEWHASLLPEDLYKQARRELDAKIISLNLP